MSHHSRAAAGSAAEVFWTFLKLGLTSFGGPSAHLGYFRTEIVGSRRWLTDDEYAELVALCQFLPGPASSQVGVGLGLRRAGWLGAAAAAIAFAVPSAGLMLAFAYGVEALNATVASGVITGLKVVAVAIIAHALLGMARTLTPDRARAAIAVVAAASCLLIGSAGQLAAIAAGVLAGLVWCRRQTPAPRPLAVTIPRRVGFAALAAFAVLLGLGPTLATTGSEAAALFDAFYRSGALVFGGGHVVLPLLHSAVVEPGWVPEADFLAGYGAAQAIPGPLFTFASFLGADAAVGPGGPLGALLALVAIFLPGYLLLIGVLPFWDAVRQRPAMQAAIRGANAAVVGILTAALADPVFITAITGVATLTLAVLCFVLLTAFKAPAWVVVIVGAGTGLLVTLIG